MHFPDLGTHTQIAEGPYVRAVGWLDASHAFATGQVPPEVATRIGEYAARWGQSVEALVWPVAAGQHECDLCSGFLAGGNFGVPAGDTLFVCPEMVAHYVTVHRYLPPREFLDAIMAAPLPGSETYATVVTRFRAP